jgi:glycine/D-amino acid oxidase-like deaminating enzyme
MKTRFGVPYWLDRYPKTRQPSYSRHRGSLDVQVAIVGGGLVGCATAYAFAVAGVRVALLEADRVGQGSSAGCPGLLRLEPALPFRSLQHRRGLKATRAIWQIYRRAGLDLAATIRRLNIRCEVARDGALFAGLHAADAKTLQREIQAIRGAGVEGTWLTPGALRRETGLTGVGAIRFASNGSVDPYRVTLGFASAAARRHALIFERSRVSRVKPAGTGVDVIVEGGVIHAEHVVIASNYPTPAFAPLRRHFTLNETYCVLTPPLPSFVRREFGRSRATVIDQADPPHQLRRLSDGRVLCLGADGPHLTPRAREKAVVQRTGQLMYELSKLYPAMSGIQPEYGWSLAVSSAVDGLPCVGPHRNYPRHLFALGLGHHGLGAAWLAARVLVRHYLGHPAEEDALLGFARLLRR